MSAARSAVARCRASKSFSRRSHSGGPSAVSTREMVAAFFRSRAVSRASTKPVGRYQGCRAKYCRNHFGRKTRPARASIVLRKRISSRSGRRSSSAGVSSRS